MSDEVLNKNPSNVSAEDMILQELDKVSSHLGQVREAAKKIEASGSKDAPIQHEKEEKWKVIMEKIGALESEIDSIRSAVREQEKRFATVVDQLMEQRSDNVKVRAEIVCVQIALQTERQQNRKGALIICGLPPKAAINEEQIFTNICKKIEIDPAPVSASPPMYKVIKVENKSVSEKRLEVSNLGAERAALIMAKYREARKKTWGPHFG